eukprot:1160058-Pelagomonas_calceolata.AAC.19
MSSRPALHTCHNLHCTRVTTCAAHIVTPCKPCAAGKAVAVPGKTLAAVLARCSSGSSSSGRASASGLSPEALASVEAFHAQVVEHLVLMGGGGGGGTDAAARQARLAESLAQQLPAMKCLAGLEQDRE